jgi:hypothetical protein
MCNNPQNYIRKVSTAVIAILISLFGFIASATEVPSSLTYQGRLFATDGTTPLVANVDFKLQIYDPTATCLLYEESQENISLTDGLFSISVGTELGNPRRGSNDPALTMSVVFSNQNSSIRSAGSSNCAAGYTPSSGDKRKLKVTVFNRNTNTTSVLSPLHELSMSPYSLISGQSVDSTKLGGKASNEFIQTSANITQTSLENWLSSSVMPQLLSGTYSPSGLAPLATSGSASDLTSGTVPMSRLGSSGTRDASTFLRGDGTWATPAGGGGSSSPTGSASGDLGGTYPNPSVVKVRGFGFATTSPADGQVYRYNGTNSEFEPVYFGVDDLKTSLGASQFSSSCLASQTLTWSSVTDSFVCTNIAISKSQISDLPTSSFNKAQISYSPTINLDLDGVDAVDILLEGNPTIATPINAIEGKSYNFIFKQDASGNRVPTFSSGFRVLSQFPTGSNLPTVVYGFTYLDGKFLETSHGQLAYCNAPPESHSANATITVPANCNNVLVYMWGAGGAGGNTGTTYQGGAGGGGAFLKFNLAVTPGHSANLVVGGGGSPAGTGGANGGGNGIGGSDACHSNGGGGGGYTSLTVNSSLVAIVGGGGGGAGGSCNSGPNGAGGGGGVAGTAGSGGGGAGGALEASSTNSGLAGTGSGTGVGSGGGGGGYKGGGGGVGRSGGAAGGGAGGTHFLYSGTLVTYENGNGTSPGGAADPNRGTSGTGGNTATSGSNGKVYLIWGN